MLQGRADAAKINKQTKLCPISRIYLTPCLPSKRHSFENQKVPEVNWYNTTF